MAATTHNTIRLDITLASDLPSNQYDIEMTSVERPFAAVSSEFGLTGKLHVHRLMDGASPKSYRDWPVILHLNRAQYDTLRAQVGKKMYFMPNYRDEADYASHRYVVLLESMEPVEMIDPMQTYFRVTVLLRDATGLTVDA